MSDVMLLAVLRMPLPQAPDSLTVWQLAAMARQAADRIEANAAEIERLKSLLSEAEKWVPGKPGTVGELATDGLLSRIEAAMSRPGGLT